MLVRVSTFDIAPDTFPKLNVSGSNWTLIGSNWPFYVNINNLVPENDRVPVFVLNYLLLTVLWGFHRFQTPPTSGSTSNWP